MNKFKVLFVCIHNSARSQMAEAFMNNLCGNDFEASSAGLEPGRLNPLVVKAMLEQGIDISENKTKGVNEFIASGEKFSFVITVCDQAHAEACPVFPGKCKRLHWNFKDPGTLTGTENEKILQIRAIRDEIRNKIIAFCKSHSILTIS